MTGGRMRALAALALAAACLVAAACGGSGGAQEPPTVVVALDFIPNAVHAPIYTAVRDGRDRQHGVRLQIRKPGAGPDSLKLVAAGKVDLGSWTSTTSRSPAAAAATSSASAR
jgi:putative hydroxymethylpyrimidine transport system substrate-binding protein